MSAEQIKARSNQLRIGTHNGTFHADEALAVYLLKSLNRFKSADVIRTRDPSILADCDIVVDVGGEYDPGRHRYDHHQREFEETYSIDHRTKLSSAGLVYKHFGSEIIAEHLKLKNDDPHLSVLVSKMYKVFIEAIDGIDNGVNQHELVGQVQDPKAVSIRPRYYDGSGLSNRISHLNPSWNEPNSSEIADAQFFKASTLAGTEFFDRLNYYYKSWLPGRQLVVNVLKRRFDNESKDSLGRVLIFETYCPWKDHLHQLEKELKLEHDQLPLYVIYPDESEKWRIQAIPKQPNGFESRKPLPESWRGIRDEQLSELIGLKDCIFVHSSGFIGGHLKFEGVLEMAKKALDA